MAKQGVRRESDNRPTAVGRSPPIHRTSSWGHDGQVKKANVTRNQPINSRLCVTVTLFFLVADVVDDEDNSFFLGATHHPIIS